MREKRMWTAEQDKTLIYLREQLNLTKWSEIARKMRIEMSQNGKIFRNQKQCRDRYINYLRNKEHKNIWSRQNQFNLIQLHKQIGNKWALISSKFQGMTQNFIKNQFYSRLRKSIRKINHLIQQKNKKQFKKFKLNVIFKLSNLVDPTQKVKKILPSNLIEYYREYLYFLINFSFFQTEFEQAFTNFSQISNYMIKPILIVQQIYEICFNKHKRQKKNKQFILKKYVNIKKYKDQIVKVQNQCQPNQKLSIFIQAITQQLQTCLLYLNTGKFQQNFNQKQQTRQKKQLSTFQNSLQNIQKLRKSQNEQIQSQQNKKISVNSSQNISPKQQVDYVQEQSIVQRLLYEQSPSSISGFGDKISCSYGNYSGENNVQKSSMSQNQNFCQQIQRGNSKWSECFNTSSNKNMYK